MSKEKKIIDTLIQKSQESLMKSKEQTMRLLERNLDLKLNTDIQSIRNEYDELRQFAIENGCNKLLAEDIDKIHNELNDKVTLAQNLLNRNREQMFSTGLSLNMIRQMYEIRHEKELSTSTDVVTEYEDIKSSNIKKAMQDIYQAEDKALLNEIYDGLSDLKEMNQDYTNFNQSLKINPKERFKFNLLTEEMRSIQRNNLIRSINRTLDKIDFLNEKLEKTLSSHYNPIKDRNTIFFKNKQQDLKTFSDTIQESVRNLENQYNKLQLNYEESMEISIQATVKQFDLEEMQTMKQDTVACLDHLIHEAIGRHEELVEETDRVLTRDKEIEY